MNRRRYVNLILGVVPILFGIYNFKLHHSFTVINVLLFVIGFAHLIYYGPYQNRKVKKDI